MSAPVRHFLGGFDLVLDVEACVVLATTAIDDPPKSFSPMFSVEIMTTGAERIVCSNLVSVEGRECEVGLGCELPEGANTERRAQAIDVLRMSIWQATELARHGCYRLPEKGAS